MAAAVRSTPKSGKTGFFEGRKPISTTTRKGRFERMLAEKQGMMKLPKPREDDLELVFDRDQQLITLGGRQVFVDRTSAGGYQRDFDEARAMQYGRAFNWGLFGIPMLSLRDDGCYWTVSGQHRIAGAGFAGVKRIRCAVYEGLTREQEAFLFNQEATQRRDLTALDKFHSGVMAQFPDHLAVKKMVEDLGSQVAYKSDPRTGNIGGIVAINELLRTYDFAGPQLTQEALNVINAGFGTMVGKGIDGALFASMTQFLGIYSAGSQFGTADRKKLIEKLREIDPMKLRKDASNYENMGAKNARFMALRDLYNYRTQAQHRLELTNPDWRKTVSNFCTVPGCDTLGKGKPGRNYRRGLCYKHYEQARAGQDLTFAR